MTPPVMARPAGRPELVEHLLADHGLAASVAESLSAMGAALAHGTAHQAPAGHIHG